MSIYLIGGDRGGPPFGKRFFRDRINELCEACGKEDGASGQQVLLYLTDGLTLEVSKIDELAENYMTVHAAPAENGGAETVHVIPYGGIYRVQVSPKQDETRLGFHREPARRKARKKVRG